MIRQQIVNLAVTKKQQPLLIIDEASLLRLDVFAELHTLTQFQGDSKPWLPMILAGLNTSPFDDQAVTAIHQGSGGLFRKANHLARGALITAAVEKSQTVTAGHVRVADPELL